MESRHNLLSILKGYLIIVIKKNCNLFVKVRVCFFFLTLLPAVLICFMLSLILKRCMLLSLLDNIKMISFLKKLKAKCIFIACYYALYLYNRRLKCLLFIKFCLYLITMKN